jgi:hypothetical protein
MARLTFDQLTTIAALPKKASAVDTAVFHAFNPNGVVRAKQASDSRITAAVEAGKCKAGAIYAYGGMNHYHEDKLMKLAQARRASMWNVQYYVKEIKEVIARADAFLADVPASARPDAS